MGSRSRGAPKGAEVLDALGHPKALGVFIVGPPLTPGGKARTALAFRGNPTGRVVHHELWHRQDFIKNHGSDFDAWKAGKTIEKERYVHRRLEDSRRWTGYALKERADQTLYMQNLEYDDKMADVMKTLKGLGLNLD